MTHRDRFSHEPRLDRTTVGISFVDILFALVVGQILKPVADWATNSRLHSLPLQSWAALVVALVLTITSWVGYHNSANRAHYRLDFVNVELTKFCLDISMVVVYFLVASNAARVSPSLDFETRLLTIAFCLYVLWDLAGGYQKRKKSLWWSSSNSNPYYLEWERVRADPDRRDVLNAEKWRDTNWARVWVTIGMTVVFGALYGIVQIWFAGHNDDTTTVIVSSAIVVLLLTYRLIKEFPGAAPERP